MSKNDQSLISIIVPVYKVEKYLRRCIESILNQTYTNIEVILVDDGSPDDCPAICDEYAQKDSRIIVIHKENGGLSDARNAGLNIAKGKFIGFVDSDDYIAPDMYQILITAALTNNADITLCNYTRVNEENIKIESLQYATDKKYSKSEFIQELIQPYGSYYVVVWNKLYRNTIFEDLRFPIGKQHEDEYVIHYMIDSSSVIVSVKDTLYYYLQRQGSIMSGEFNVKNLDYGEALLDRYYFVKSKKYYNWKNHCVLKLSSALDLWKGCAYKDPLVQQKYDEIRKKSLFLIFERSAWNEYDISLKGKIFMRIEHVFPRIAKNLRRRFHKEIN